MTKGTSIDKFFKTASKEEKNILIKIAKLAQEEQKYCEQINNIYSSINSGIYSLDGHSLTICEDADDAKVISIKPRENLKYTKNQIKQQLIKAVEIGMGHVGAIQRQYEPYVGKPIPKN